MKVIFGASLAMALVVSPASLAQQSWPQCGAHEHRVYKYGGGWDSRLGYYVGPIFKGRDKGYFRCWVPGYGWRRC
jgi:hypothetical protein